MMVEQNEQLEVPHIRRSGRPAMSPFSSLTQVDGDRLRALRLAKGWSLQELGDVSGLSKATLSNLERGKSKISPGSLRRLTGSLQISAEDLLPGDLSMSVGLPTLERLESSSLSPQVLVTLRLLRLTLRSAAELTELLIQELELKDNKDQ